MFVKKTSHIGSITDQMHNVQLKAWNVSIERGCREYIPHRHINFEIMIVNSGQGRYATHNGTYPMLPGDLFVFSSNECHCITAVGEDGLKITNLQFDPIFIRDSFPHPNFCFVHSKSFCNKISYENEKSPKALFQQICTELKQQNIEYELSVKSYLNLLLLSLIRDFNYTDNSTAQPSSNISGINLAFTYIDEHFTEKITLKELSALIGLTPNYFCALFKQVSGMTIWEYITVKRIDRSIQLLTAKDISLNILEIANLSGFNNTANFNKAFKKTTGVTPKEYRANRSSLIS